MIEPTELNEDSLDGFSCASRGPALVAFASLAHASNESLPSLLQELGREFAHRVSIGCLDIDIAPRVASGIQIEGPLTLVFFCLGEPFAHVFGLHGLPALKRWLTLALHACAECEQSLGVAASQ